MKNNYTLVQCHGINLMRLINICTSSGVNFHDLRKINSTCVEFYLNDKSLHKFQSIDLSAYDVKYIKYGGKKYLKRYFVSRLGIIIGCIVSIIMFLFTNNRLLNIKVIGLIDLHENEIINSVNEFGLNTFSSLNFDKSELEKYLSEKFNLSLINVITKGNTLIISVKEEINNSVTTSDAIISPYNMVIRSIQVYSGTTNLSSGSIVYKGDILVYPYNIINGIESHVKPCADIEADVFITNSYNFYTKEYVLQRTGNYKVQEISYNLGKIKLFTDEYDAKYDNYEEEFIEMYISQYFLPIKVVKKIKYELAEAVVERDFELEKDTLIQNLISNCYDLVDNTLVVNDEKVEITAIKDGYIINVYLKSSISLNYKD